MVEGSNNKKPEAAAMAKPRPRKRTSFQTFASWLAFSLVIAQMYTFNGNDWAKVFIEETETVDDSIQPHQAVATEDIDVSNNTKAPSKQRHLKAVDDQAASSVNETTQSNIPDEEKATESPNNSSDNAPDATSREVPATSSDKDSSTSSTFTDLVKPSPGASPVVCTFQDNFECCGTWDVNADEWWLQHPDWEVSSETKDSFCFAPMKDQRKASFLKMVHEVQWNGNCSQVEKSVEMNSGYGASTTWLNQAFWHAHKQGKPFQIVNGNRVWLYSTKDESSWAYCDTKDTRCYWLPISSCSREETIRGEHQGQKPNGSNREKEQYHWLRTYMTRPRQHFRRKLLEMRESIPLEQPCATMHVRRGDVGFPRPPFRRYAAVQEYIDKARIKEGDNVFLMTDDQSTIDEINKHLPNYTWIYIDRPRNDGIKNGFDGHVPAASDPGYEMLVIETELRLAQSCDKLVYGNSGFMKSLIETLDLEGKNYTRYYLDTTVSKEEARKFSSRDARVETFLAEIEALYQNKTSTTPNPLAQKESSSSQSQAEISRSSKQGNSGNKGDKKLHEQGNPNAAIELTNSFPLFEANVSDLMTCQNVSGRPTCCAPWDVEADGWWHARPDWEVSLENDTSYCFSPMANMEKARVMREIHDRQWINVNCSDMERSSEINSGVGASWSWLANSFWHAHVLKKHFQIARSNWHWMYAAKNKSSWAYCEDEDITCYSLPVSPCSRDGFNQDDRKWWKPKKDTKEVEEGMWLRDYMLRPRQVFRRKAYEMRQQVAMEYPCTMMHVRRGDSGLPRPPFRRYAAVQEYLDAASVQEGDNILLLTDDQSTIDEVKEHHPMYNWIYLDRPRNHGSSGGWNGHIPSGKGEFEMLAIDTELKLASKCNKVVYGYSGFMKAFLQNQITQGRDVALYYVDTTVTKEEAKSFQGNPKERAASLLKDIETKREEADKHNAKLKDDDEDDSEDSEDEDDSRDDSSEASQGKAKKTGRESGKRHQGNGRGRQSHDKTRKAAVSNAIAVANPLNCQESANGTSCCGSWDIDADKWWQHSPDFEVSVENSTSFCFSPMQNKEKASFLRRLHEVQWSGNCSTAVNAWQINSGFGASTSWLAYAFLKAHQKGTPFQINAPERDWLYGPTDNSSWAYCDDHDITCYFLPISSCPRQTTRQEREWTKPGRDPQTKKEYEWLREYLFRPKQIMRRQLLEMRESLNLPQPCVTIHIRRGDAGFPRQPFRRYAAVQEYLDAGYVEDGANIMLLTDDASTIDEINEHHRGDYNWVYLNRPRTRGVDGGWQSHVPSSDGAFEVLSIYTEFALASKCDTVVQGHSGFMRMLLGKMENEGKPFKRFVVSTGVSKDEAVQWPNDGKERLEYFKKQMDEYRRKSKEAKLASTTSS
ncbi:expressed unknown protein [Seminavis robusta]|uniref:Uncharacterized protein n=1 Tax=Seminavis robusta TaxID=568900 RepID=A0A9N8E132_9STRA|nr:expressed unknown protein [Seminavis robusta]|eukprot:Sro442_g143900.1 n/a (1387) ;mRNA; f:32915-37555